ncbi:hypothetical protein [Nocardia fluminea]|uniref:hypothetical protein n=1 Tax=Nocardia fluminea TaxID=134984 RepID=UPI003D0A9E75
MGADRRLATELVVISAKVTQDIYFVVVATFVDVAVTSAASCCFYTTSGNHSIS